MKGHGAKFDRMKDEAIAALLSHKSIEDAARAIGVNPNTLSRWMKETEFLEGLEGARTLMYSEAIERLREGSGAAANTILKVMIDPSSPAAARLKAAEIVLDKAEITKDFEHRLAKIEALLQLPLRSPTPSPDAGRSKSTPLLGSRAAMPQIAAGTSDPALDDEGERKELAS
jgi:transposase-like protein